VEIDFTAGPYSAPAAAPPGADGDGPEDGYQSDTERVGWVEERDDPEVPEELDEAFLVDQALGRSAPAAAPLAPLAGGRGGSGAGGRLRRCSPTSAAPALACGHHALVG